jgi:hypothetical protein
VESERECLLLVSLMAERFLNTVALRILRVAAFSDLRYGASLPLAARAHSMRARAAYASALSLNWSGVACGRHIHPCGA